VLWNQVIQAREAVAKQRHLPAGASGSDARMELLSALEAYVASLLSRGRPIPYVLRDELRLQRLTCPSARAVRYVPLTGRPPLHTHGKDQ
jgi:hypothetical protein